MQLRAQHMRQTPLLFLVALISTSFSFAEETKQQKSSNEAETKTGQTSYEALSKRVRALEKKLRSNQGNPVYTKPTWRWQTRFGGRLFTDFVLPSADNELETAVGNFESKSEVRKARFFVTGAARGGMKFKFELDFAQGDVDLTDTYISLPFRRSPATVHIGRMKEPFGLENASSSNNILMMERAMVNRSLVPFRNTGIMIINRRKPNGQLNWWTGYFKNTNSYGIEDDKGGQNWTTRVTWQPRHENGGRQLTHFGFNFSHHQPENSQLNIEAKSGSNLIPVLGETGVMAVEHANIVGFEGAWQKGAWTFITEGAQSLVSLENGQEAKFRGFYATVGWFITGEHTRFKWPISSFSTVRPKKEFYYGRGGAWQVVLRYQTLDLNSEGEGINGGEFDEWGLGVNYFLHKNARIMLNYLRPEVDDVGKGKVWQMRFQYDF